MSLTAELIAANQKQQMWEYQYRLFQTSLSKLHTKITMPKLYKTITAKNL